MKVSLRIVLILSALTLSAINGCGGGGDTVVSPPPPSPSPPPVGGITRNGLSFGTVSSFSSVVVNGIHYDTATTIFTINGNPGTESDLKVGHVVLVEGTVNADSVSGSADSVSSDDLVTGPVDSITPPNFIVMGQTILVGPDTSFDANISPASIEGLVAGDIVEVHGFFTAPGDIDATRIEKKPAGTTVFEVYGTVSNLASANATFSISGLVVDFSGATLSDFPGGQISDGDFVEAKGTIGAGSSVLAAGSVDLKSKGISANEGDHAEVEGFITRLVSATDFDVAGTPVTTSGATVFEGGTAADLALNIKVEVEGEIVAGVLGAEKVDIRRGKAVRVVAIVDSLSNDGNGQPLPPDSLAMLGITFKTDGMTRFEDKSDADLRSLAVRDINVGDYLEIRGTEFPVGASPAVVLVALLERDDDPGAPPRTRLQGFVESVADPMLTILGVDIDTTNTNVFRDVSGAAISRADFFSRVGVNSLVKARGTETGDTQITASQMELKLEL